MVIFHGFFVCLPGRVDEHPKIARSRRSGGPGSFAGVRTLGGSDDFPHGAAGELFLGSRPHHGWLVWVKGDHIRSFTVSFAEVSRKCSISSLFNWMLRCFCNAGIPPKKAELGQLRLAKVHQITPFRTCPFFHWLMNRRVDNNTLWLFNIAMENGPFIDGLPINNGDFPWLC